MMDGTATSTAEISLALEPTPLAAARARQALRGEARSGEVEETLALLTTELVSNAVRHARVEQDHRIVVSVEREPGLVRVRVYDGGEGFDPELRHSAPGYGLRLLDMLASRWGVTLEGGCLVWFELVGGRAPLPAGARTG